MDASTDTEQVDWRSLVRPYATPDERRSTWQLVSTLVPYALTWTAICLAASAPWWVAALLAVVAALLLARMYSLFHDLAHGALYRSRRVNDTIGTLLGYLAFTPYQAWRHDHNLHHKSTGDLDHRGPGDLATLTVAEYQGLARLRRIGYRIYRNPIVLLVAGPIVAFGIDRRVPHTGSTRKIRRSVHATNLFMAAWIVGFGLLLGWAYLLLVQATILMVGGMIGVWMLYVQHNYEDAYHRRNEDWDFAEAAILGSSYLRLPRVLDWITGNAGYHHVHHLSARIPNYRLREVHERHPYFQRATELGILDGVRSMRLKLWDEAGERMIGWRELRNA